MRLYPADKFQSAGARRYANGKMRTFTYRHWGSELVLIGAWSAAADGDSAEAVESGLRDLQEAVWSDSPPQLQPGPELESLLAWEHPLARALVLIYHAVSRHPADLGHAELLRQAARQVLQQAPIAHVEATDAAPFLQAGVVSEEDGAYVRWAALYVLRDLAQAADFPLLARWLPVPEGARGASSAVASAQAALVEQQTEAVWGLRALVLREPGLKTSSGLEQLLLRLVQSAGVEPPVRSAAMQALLAGYPSAEAELALGQVAADATAGEAGWAAAVALFGKQPEPHAELLLAVYRRASRPESFNPLFTQLALDAEAAALRIALRRPDGALPLLWFDGGTVFALCQADGAVPPGADEPSMAEIGGAWTSAPDALRARLLCQLSESGHPAGRALAILAGPAPAAEPAEDEELAYDEDGHFAADLDADTVTLHAAAAAPPPAEVQWRELARAVLQDPPLTRLIASDVSDGSTVPRRPTDLHPSNHCAALTMLGDQGAPSDAALLTRWFLAASQSDNPIGVAAIKALYCHSARYCQPPPDSQLLARVIELANAGSGELRREAVQLLGCWPAEQTGATLRALAQDPTFAVCCIAERALAAQSFAAGEEPEPIFRSGV